MSLGSNTRMQRVFFVWLTLCLAATGEAGMKAPAPPLAVPALSSVASSGAHSVDAVHYRGRIRISATTFPAPAQSLLVLRWKVRVRARRSTRHLRFQLTRSARALQVRIDGLQPVLRDAGGEYQVFLPRVWLPASLHVLRFQYVLRAPQPNLALPPASAANASAWYPVFSSRPFTTDLTFTFPAHWKLGSRGELVSWTAGRQHWVDNTPSSSIALVAGTDVRVTTRDVPGVNEQIFSAAGVSAPARRQIQGILDKTENELRMLLGAPRLHALNVAVIPALVQVEGDAGFVAAPAGGSPQEQQWELARAVAALWWPPSSSTTVDSPARLLRALQNWSAMRAVRAQLPAAPAQLWLCRRNEQWQREASDPAQSRASSSGPARETRQLVARDTLVLSALKLQIGAPQFSHLLAAYAAAPSPRSLTSFEALAESISHQDLDWFWRQWLTPGRLPRLDFSWRRIRLPRSGETVQVRMRQHGKVFSLRAPLLIVTSRGNYLQMVDVRNADTILGIPVSGTVSSVQIDPEHLLPVEVKSAPLPIRTVHVRRARRTRGRRRM